MRVNGWSTTCYNAPVDLITTHVNADFDGLASMVAARKLYPGAAHCHTDAGSCSDAPVGSGGGQFLTSEPLLTQPVLLSVLILLTAPLLVGISRRPLVRPPLAFSTI